MLSDYRNWLESELKLLGSASHHAYSFGQANMAKRAIERLDAELADKAIVVLPRDQAGALLERLDTLAPPDDSEGGAAIEALRTALRAALAPV
ncbi:MAG TPA: hypothetical protein VGD50_02565 [Candidatus Baltobacteraceae bacterium]